MRRFLLKISSYVCGAFLALAVSSSFSSSRAAEGSLERLSEGEIYFYYNYLKYGISPRPPVKFSIDSYPFHEIMKREDFSVFGIFSEEANCYGKLTIAFSKMPILSNIDRSFYGDILHSMWESGVRTCMTDVPTRASERDTTNRASHNKYGLPPNTRSRWYNFHISVSGVKFERDFSVAQGLRLDKGGSSPAFVESVFVEFFGDFSFEKKYPQRIIGEPSYEAVTKFRAPFLTSPRRGAYYLCKISSLECFPSSNQSKFVYEKWLEMMRKKDEEGGIRQIEIPDTGVDDFNQMEFAGRIFKENRKSSTSIYNPEGGIPQFVSREVADSEKAKYRACAATSYRILLGSSFFEKFGRNPDAWSLTHFGSGRLPNPSNAWEADLAKEFYSIFYDRGRFAEDGIDWFMTTEGARAMTTAFSKIALGVFLPNEVLISKIGTPTQLSEFESLLLKTQSKIDKKLLDDEIAPHSADFKQIISSEYIEGIPGAMTRFLRDFELYAYLDCIQDFVQNPLYGSMYAR